VFNQSKKEILVTGADGLIGLLIDVLVRQSHGWLDHCGESVNGKIEVFAADLCA